VLLRKHRVLSSSLESVAGITASWKPCKLRSNTQVLHNQRLRANFALPILAVSKYQEFDTVMKRPPTHSDCRMPALEQITIAPALTFDALPPSSISPYSATRRRWRQRLPGTAPAARSAVPSARPGVPTLYIWGDADDTVGRVAAKGTVDFVAAPYRFESCPVSAISRRIRWWSASPNYCWSIWQHIQCNTANKTAAEEFSSAASHWQILFRLVDIPEHRCRRAVEHAAQ
jgi:hypothetical protein